ncbi:MAG TPA: PaaI family thioesterase [Acidimicrobiales bacterium]|nr:PaaI family thioesterase [Acidimicrobiales bacterium]
MSDPMHDAMPFMKLLDIETVTNTAAEVRLRMPWREELCTTLGIMHGGAIMSLADTAGAMCAFLNLPEGAGGTTTIESKTNFLRAVRDGVVEAVATPLHAGRKVIVVETDVLDDAGKRVARVTQTQAVL